jgi:hypothetical protein
MCRPWYWYCHEERCPNKIIGESAHWTCGNDNSHRKEPGYCGKIYPEKIARLEDRTRSATLYCPEHQRQYAQGKGDDAQEDDNVRKAQERTVARNAAQLATQTLGRRQLPASMPRMEDKSRATQRAKRAIENAKPKVKKARKVTAREET